MASLPESGFFTLFHFGPTLFDAMHSLFHAKGPKFHQVLLKYFNLDDPQSLTSRSFGCSGPIRLASVRGDLFCFNCCSAFTNLEDHMKDSHADEDYFGVQDVQYSTRQEDSSDSGDNHDSDESDDEDLDDWDDSDYEDSEIARELISRFLDL